MFTFVVLHYKSIEQTIKCLESIKNTFNDNKYSIVVVDNNSLSNEQIISIKKYTNDIVLLKENVGFAKANNIGCKYAIEKYNSDFLIVINNDVYVTQNSFLKIIKEDFDKYNFDMLGPWIDSRTGESVNPFPIISGKENIEKEIKYCSKLINIYSSSILYFLLKTYLSVKHIFRKPSKPKNGDNTKAGIGLHGCSIIFSKKYFEKYNNVFYDNTFLFHEEEFLYLRMKRDNLCCLYDPKLKVFHEEGSSVNVSNGSKRKSKLFREKERIKSLELLLKEMQGE